MNFVTYAALNADIIANIHRIPKDIDVVAGIPRSGLLVANIIALYLNKPLCDFDSFLQGRIYNSGTTKNKNGWVKDFSDVKKVLIVEDSVCSGASIKKAKELFQNKGFENITAVWFAAYVWKKNASLVDIYLRTIDLPRAFEWNYLHIKILENMCFDIDGILCEDPTSEQNDDDEKYKKFLLEAPQKFLPTQEIGCIVTSRLEKYRGQTEEWLTKNNIHYKKLIMMNVESAEERRKLGNHAEFKASIYKQRNDMILFVESEPCQAETICRISKKAVYCPTNQKFYEESLLTTLQSKSKKGIKNLLYPFIPKFLLRLYRKIKYGRNIN